LFVGRNDSRFTALDKANGRLLWDFPMDAAVNATASTFEHKGKQYVVVLAAGSFFPGTKHGDSLWLFSLDGQFQPTPSTAATPDSSAPATVLTH
jgi:glucose dehydrogenase